MQTLNLFNLSGKTALVTGCDTGLGQGMAIALAEAGANIIGASLKDNFQVTREAVEATGRSFSSYKVNISNRSELYRFIDEVKADAHKVDILINNAGIILRKPAYEHPDEYWDMVIATNLDAQFILGREFGKHMIENGGGKIIFICSLLSFQGGINVPGYTASKSAVAGLVRAFGNEWGSKDVLVRIQSWARFIKGNHLIAFYNNQNTSPAPVLAILNVDKLVRTLFILVRTKLIFR